MNEAVFRVTAIERQARNPARVNVYLDGAFAFGLDEEVLFRHPIHEGDDLSESFIDGVLLADERVRAKAKALRLLTHRALTSAELRDKLLDRDFSERSVDKVLEDLVRVGLINDASFAAAFVHNRMLQRPSAKRLLVVELLRKGLAEEDAGRIVDEAYGPASEAEVAATLCRRKLQTLQGGDPRKSRKKAVEFLFRRGFDWETIQGVLETAQGDEPGTAD
jgi:regulatory protein